MVLNDMEKRGSGMIITDRLANESGRDYALRIIKKNIVSLQLAPGSKINDQEIAAKLGLSRTPVREALIELSKVSIVVMYPQRGSFVAPIDYQLMEEAYFMREMLECGVVDRCCTMRDQSVFDPLYEILALQQFYLDNRNPDKLMELDNDFHKKLFEIAGVPHVFTILSGLTIHFDRIRSLSYRSVKIVKAVSAHRAILAAISEQNSDMAVRLMREHLGYFQAEREELMSGFPQYFVKKYE